MPPIVLHLILVLLIASPFFYFVTAGAQIFTVPKLRDAGIMFGALSFVSGMFGVLGFGLFHRLELSQGLCGVGLAVCSLTLYEWTRRTIQDLLLDERAPGRSTAVYGYAEAAHVLRAAAQRYLEPGRGRSFQS
jgi:hypothetical protein